jgi:cell division septum initiation protein DivIVA
MPALNETISRTVTQTNASVNERLDDLERQLPSIPSKMLGLTRAVTDRAGAAFCGAATAMTRPATAVKREGESVARSTNVAARTTVGQARSATERTVDAVGANTREVVGQARAQTGRVADQAQDSVEQLLDDATAAVETDKRPARLEDLTKAELYERAQARDISGRATMSKPQLIRALRSN